MAKKDKNSPGTQTRFGIGEWYGRSFIRLTPEERHDFADSVSLLRDERPPCLPRSTPGHRIDCSKNSGVCSIRQYQRVIATDQVSPVPYPSGTLRTTCPYRFFEDRMIFKWIGEVMLGTSEPLLAPEIGFLEREPAEISGDAGVEPPSEDVGRIDQVLVHPDREPLHWCAMEIQAVYFSGAGMNGDFKIIRAYEGDTLPFPSGMRRPDYRSSGPKRLMPQLQIKVPSLRRWGKKMAILVDHDFFRSLGRMDNVPHVSNCDIAWFIVQYDESAGEAKLVCDEVRLTTLERAVEGLTAGRPVDLETFEDRIRKKLTRNLLSASL